MTTFEIGQVIRGKYRIDQVIGKGGMGVVVAAHHIALDQRVAIKFLRPAILSDSASLARFAREARAASKIQSDHVARVIDVDALEDGAPFMVMEYLEGGDLSSVRRLGQPLAVHVAAGYVIEACEAIGEAHGLGIVHRDIKPANLFLAQRAAGKTRVKVLDFGISKMAAADASDTNITNTTAVIGSAEYMSPEQMRSLRDVDPRTDIWSLGITLYELATARMPFPGKTITQVCALVMAHHPDPPSTLLGDIPVAFDAVVLRCLEKNRNRRYGSIAELAEALAPFVTAASSLNLPSPRSSSDRFSSADWLSPASVPASSGPRTLPPTGEPEPAPPNAGPGPGRGSFPSNPEELAVSVSSPLVADERLASTTGAISRRPAPSTSRLSGALIAASAVAVVVLGGVAVLALKHSQGAPPSDSAPASSATSAEASAAPSPATTVGAPSVEASAVRDPVAASSASAPAPSSGDAGVHQKPAIAPAGQPPPPVPRPNCKPPFTIDARGIKHAKPECS